MWPKIFEFASDFYEFYAFSAFSISRDTPQALEMTGEQKYDAIS